MDILRGPNPHALPATRPGPCLGCADCAGVCRALLEALTVPDLVLGRRG